MNISTFKCLYKNVCLTKPNLRKDVVKLCRKVNILRDFKHLKREIKWNKDRFLYDKAYDALRTVYFQLSDTGVLTHQKPLNN